MILSCESSLDGARAIVNDHGLIDENVLGRVDNGQAFRGGSAFCAHVRYAHL